MTDTQIDQTAAVRAVAARIYDDFQRWQNGILPEERSAGFDCMHRGIAALRHFGYAKTYHMASGRFVQERLRSISSQLPPRPDIDTRKVPTKADVAASHEWQNKLELVLLQEFAPELFSHE